MKKIRLDKYLADHTEWTRSQIKKKVASGLVKVQDAVIKDAGYKVSAEDVIEMEGQRICGQQYQYLLFHKPAGIVSATEDTREETVLDAVRRGGFAGEGEVPFLAKDLFPMGRLDKDTEGLLILTNDGELAHRLLSPKFHVEKTYLVQLDTAVSGEDVLHMKEGLDIGEKQLTKPAKMEILSERECLLTITEGKFHQVKRMFHKLGKEVVYLKRVAMAGIKLEDSLEKGQWRQLTEKEIEKLQKELLDCNQERKKEILHLLQNTVSRIQNGSYNIEKGSLFCVADEFKIDSLTNWSTEILECRKKSGIIYSSRDGYDAHYKLTVIYGYDKMNKKVYPIKNELECISYSGIEITCNDLPIVKYNEVEGKLQGTCYGNLFFKDEKGATHSEDFTKYFVLEP